MKSKRTTGRADQSGSAQRDPDASLLAPGGKVDPDKVRAAHRAARASELVELGDADAEVELSEDDESVSRVCFRLTRDLNKRLDRYLQDRISYLSRTQLQRLIKEQAVTVNGRVPKASTTLRIDDEIEVVLPPPPSNEIPPEDIPLDVIQEDDDLIVLNKQDDIIVHPARGNKTGTIINALSYHFRHHSSGSLSTVGADQIRPGVVHRLDRHTTGALVVAKSDTAHWRLAKQFEERTTDKRYLAIVVGTVEPNADTIDLPIGKHPTIRELMAVRYDASAKPATTIYRVREQFDGFALVELELKTGRTHQIRVHLSHLGWPIVGDDLYDGPLLNWGDVVSDSQSAEGDQELMHRQALHAWSIAFRHPSTNTEVQFEAPIPPDFLQLLTLLREHRRKASPITPPGATIDLDHVFRATY